MNVSRIGDLRADWTSPTIIALIANLRDEWAPHIVVCFHVA